MAQCQVRGCKAEASGEKTRWTLAYQTAGNRLEVSHHTVCAEHRRELIRSERDRRERLRQIYAE